MTTATAQITRPFRPTVGLSRCIFVFLTALIIGGLIVLLTYFNFIGSVNRFIKDPPKTFIEATMARSEIMGRARTFDGLYQLFNFLSIPTGVLINILLMIWVYRSVSNLVAFNVQGLRFTPGWAVGWFFLPFANLIINERTRLIWGRRRNQFLTAHGVGTEDPHHDLRTADQLQNVQGSCRLSRPGRRPDRRVVKQIRCQQ